MGVFNTIKLKEGIECPICGSIINEFQSKDLQGTMYSWTMGEQIRFNEAGLEFMAGDNAIWLGIIWCHGCSNLIEADIIIEGGILKGVKILDKR